MLLRALGSGAPKVSAVSYGGMPLSIQGRPHDEAQAMDVIHSVLDAGVTLIDTANVYCLDDDDIGHNERLITKAISSWPGNRATIVVATKGGMTRPDGRWERDARPGRLKAACERSLHALGVECIDLYQLHAPDPEVPFQESVRALADLQNEGKIKWIGLSNVTVEQIEIARQSIDSGQALDKLERLVIFTQSLVR